MSDDTEDNVTRLPDRASLPDGPPAITFNLDDDAITFRDQAALGEYVVGATAAADEDFDIQHVKHADGRCTISIEGQGHMPCTEHSADGVSGDE